MKKNIVSILLLFSGLFANDLQIHGQIFDRETNQYLPDVNIKIASQDRGTFSDINGEFSLKLSMNDQIKITRIGYISKTIKVKSDERMTIYLTPTVLQLKRVNVSGKEYINPIEKPYVESRSINYSKIQVSSTEIDRQNSQNLIDALNFIPGGYF